MRWMKVALGTGARIMEAQKQDILAISAASVDAWYHIPK